MLISKKHQVTPKEQLLAVKHLEGVQTLNALWEVSAAKKINPQGVFATMSMNNLYMETAIQFIKTFRSLKKVCAKGTDKNMLNGAERTQLIWNLERELEQLNSKLRSWLYLYLCSALRMFGIVPLQAK